MNSRCALTTFRRKNHFEAEMSERAWPADPLQRRKTPAGGPPGRATKAKLIGYLANALPRLIRLSAITPSPTQRFSPASFL